MKDTLTKTDVSFCFREAYRSNWQNGQAYQVKVIFTANASHRDPSKMYNADSINLALRTFDKKTVLLRQDH